MKTNRFSQNLSFLFPMFFSAFCFYSCLTTQVFVKTTQPGIVTIPANVHKFVLVDFSGKGSACLSALQLGINSHQGFTSYIVKVDSNSSPEISWQRIAVLMNNDTNAVLIALEKLGDDWRTNPLIRPNEAVSVANATNKHLRNYPGSSKVEEQYFYYSWKIYDLKSKSVLGNFYRVFYDDNKTVAGNAFSDEIFPHEKILSRKCYTYGNRNMRKAGKFVRHGQWGNAARIWEAECKDSSSRAQAKAFYNMAIVEEKAGQLTKAIEFARMAKSMGDMNGEIILPLLLEEQGAMNAGK
ncbi:MAG: DUF6340 family protein [Bacteroidetes bacterium]|nr:DUF6340 family protein [Bacteroidota bacterium]